MCFFFHTIFLFSFISLCLFDQNFGEISEKPIRIMSFNIRNGKAPDEKNNWENRKDILVNNIKKENVHIFGVQEAFSFQNEYILKSLGNKWGSIGFGRYFGYILPEEHVEYNTSGGENCNIFYDKTRFKVLENGTYWHSSYPDLVSITWGNSIPRITSFGLFEEIINENTEEKRQRKFLVFNTHFHNERNPFYDVYTTQLIFRKYVELSDLVIPTVILGDFNMPPKTFPYNILIGDPEYREYLAIIDDMGIFVDCFGEKNIEQEGKLSFHDIEVVNNEPTFHNFEGKIFNITESRCYKYDRIDWILFTKNDFIMKDSYISYYNEYGKYPSDHFAVVAELLRINKN